MKLTDGEQSFIARRRRLVRAWPWAGAAMLILIASLSSWLMIAKPLLANPFYVISRLQQGGIQQSTVILMAGLLPVAVWTALIMCIAAVLLAFAAFSNERKYLALLERASAE